MQKLLKKVVLLNSENLKLSRIKFYCFYPLQNNVPSEQGNTIFKLGLKQNLGRSLGDIKPAHESNIWTTSAPALI